MAKPKANPLGYAESQAAIAFLKYLHDHYSKQINPNDTYLIMAVGAWIMQESGGIKRVLGNNPFNIRDSPFAIGYRQTKNGNGHFAIFRTVADGLRAAAYLLMHGGFGKGSKDADAYGYRLAINALKHGGNQAANDFLAALAMSSWDAAHYGTTDWMTAYDPTRNHLLRVYLSFTGAQIKDPHPKPAKPIPKLPRDFNYQVLVRNYTDPWAAKDLYLTRHQPQGLTVAGTLLKR